MNLLRNTQSLCFNPRVLAGGRDLRNSMTAYSTGSFNPRVLAGGRDILTLPRIVNLLVSIHASSREDATPDKCRFRRVRLVSIHASSREDATSFFKLF